MDDKSIELLKEKEKFEALFEYASMGILVANNRGIIELANSYLLGQFGYESKNEVIGKKVEILLPARYSGSHHKHRENFQKNPEPRKMGIGRDLFALKKDGTEFPVEISLSNYESVEEERIETNCSRDKLSAVIDAIKAVHPYDEVALDVYPLEEL